MTQYMVMVATGHGWLQVSPMFNTREECESHKSRCLSGTFIGRMGVEVKGYNIGGKALRVFEIR